MLQNLIPHRAALALPLTLLALAACASTGARKELPKDWWENPGKVGRMAAVGSTPLGTNESMARNTAAVDARAQLAASLKAEIQSLTELWAQEAGDLMNEASLSSMMNNEQFTRQIVDTTLLGSNVVAYHSEPRTMYALVVLEDPSIFTDNIVNEIDRRALQDDAYFETEVKKDQARQRLDELIQKKKQQYEAEVPNVEKLQ